MGLRTQTGWKRSSVALIAGACTAILLFAVVLLAVSAGGSGGTYEVRAIFDDADNVIVGEDVKIDGVKVGSIRSVTPTPEAKAAIVMRIENPGFQDFREDASCIIRPQSLIGEKFVDCLPTQPRPEGTPLPPPLGKIPDGQEGEGQHLLSVKHTSSPVGTDLLGDIAQLPEAQRLRIILNELGAGFAGRASDLHEVVERADPALRELNEVLHILASQNKVLNNLAVESDRALAPFAAVRERVAHFIDSSNTVAKASALHTGAIAKGLHDLPPFLEALGPAMERLGQLADQTTPTFTDLRAAAPGLNTTFTHLGPFSKSSNKFFKSFGATAKVSGPALRASEPLLSELQSLGDSAKPFAGSFAQLFSSLRDTGGLERLMDFIFVGAGASNGYDSLGHFLRAEVLANQCQTYAIIPGSGCSANFINLSGSTASNRSSAPASATSLVMDRTLAVLRGATPAQAIKEFPGRLSPSGAMSLAQANGLLDEQTESQTAKPVGGASARTTYYTPAPEEASGADATLLNYLLGN